MKVVTLFSFRFCSKICWILNHLYDPFRKLGTACWDCIHYLRWEQGPHFIQFLHYCYHTWGFLSLLWHPGWLSSWNIFQMKVTGKTKKQLFFGEPLFNRFHFFRILFEEKKEKRLQSVVISSVNVIKWQWML